MRSSHVLLLSLVNAATFGQKDTLIGRYLLEQNLPEEVMKCWNGDLIDRYKISSVINPFYLDMDLNSDGKEEIAISIINSQGKRGILIIDPENCSFIVLGAGESFGNGGDDFKWMHVWKVHPKNIPVEIGAGEDSPISLMGDAIYVAKPEAASALIYWDGGQYRWYQQGD